MPFTRANKVNENEADANQRQKNVNRNKNTAAVNGGRLALGEVSNNLVKNEASNRADQPTKPVVNLKHVKPKVDSYWKKNEVPSGNVKRRNSPDLAPILVTTKSVRFAKTEVPQLITIKSDGQSEVQSKQNEAGPSKRPIKRQESILSKIQTFRNAIAQTDSRSTSVSRPTTLSRPSRVIKQDPSTTSHSAKLLVDVDDIDKNDAEKPYLESEYVKDIYNYLQDLEKKFAIRENYLADQKEVTPKMRTVLIDWLNEVHLQFHLVPETYYLTVGIVDRYLQEVRSTSRKNLQLVGVSAMFIATKYEEMYPPVLRDFVFITDDTYTAEQIIEMEKYMLKKLEFDLSAPSVIHFARRFAKASNTSQIEHTMSKYFIELATVDNSMLHHFPSKVAAAAVFITMKLKSRNEPHDKLWTPTMKYYTKYTLDDLRPAVSALAKIIIDAPKAKEKAVYTKYSTTSFEKVALRAELYGYVMESLCNFNV